MAAITGTRLIAAFKAWLPFVALATILAGTVYVVSQQVLRQSANDPQIQMAEDWADTITTGTDPARLNLGTFIDPNRSLAPFGIVYDQDGNIIASSVSAPSGMKQPGGVFDSTDAAPNTEVRYTWQPSTGERFATVIKKAVYQDKVYYVLAGRNLREVEARESRLVPLVSFGWLLAIAAVAVAQHVHLIAHVARRVRRTKA